MTEREIKELRDKIGTDPILTDEEIEYIWTAMDKAEAMKPLSIYSEYTCPMCEVTISEKEEYCWHCGQKLDWED